MHRTLGPQFDIRMRLNRQRDIRRDKPVELYRPLKKRIYLCLQFASVLRRAITEANVRIEGAARTKSWAGF